MRTSKRTSNSIISPAGEPRPTVCVSSAVQNVSDLEDRSDAGRYNCCFSVDIVSVRFSCRQSRTVYCVEAFVRRPVMTVCACLLCKCVSVYLSSRESDTVSAVCFVMVVVMSSRDLVHHVSCADCSPLFFFFFFFSFHSLSGRPFTAGLHPDEAYMQVFCLRVRHLHPYLQLRASSSRVKWAP